MRPNGDLDLLPPGGEPHSYDEFISSVDALVISRKTVDHHRANILEKLGMRNGAELTRYAIRRGLVEP